MMVVILLRIAMLMVIASPDAVDGVFGICSFSSADMLRTPCEIHFSCFSDGGPCFFLVWVSIVLVSFLAFLLFLVLRSRFAASFLNASGSLYLTHHQEKRQPRKCKSSIQETGVRLHPKNNKKSRI